MPRRLTAQLNPIRAVLSGIASQPVNHSIGHRRAVVVHRHLGLAALSPREAMSVKGERTPRTRLPQAPGGG